MTAALCFGCGGARQVVRGGLCQNCRDALRPLKGLQAGLRIPVAYRAERKLRCRVYARRAARKADLFHPPVL